MALYIQCIYSLYDLIFCCLSLRVSCVFAGDYDGALSVFTEMQLICQERGLQLPGTSTPVGEALIGSYLQALPDKSSHMWKTYGMDSH